MKKRKPPRIELSRTMKEAAEPLAVFALLNLGIVQSLASGVATLEDAVEGFYHGDNCMFVRRDIRNRTADTIMSRGAQLADLFAILPEAEARREFYAEIEAIRSLCLKLLGSQRSASIGARVAA
jgi:hypothetical protein